jgi:acyl-CoA synthetase (AMP-forming)/AMP-acid ligase II
MEKKFLIYENQKSYTRSEFDEASNIFADQLRLAGYDRTCRIGLYDTYTNLIKAQGVMQVCSVVLFDQTISNFELSMYPDIDIWEDELPEPRFAQCSIDEKYGFQSSGTTDAPRIIPWHTYEYEGSGLESNLKKHLTSDDSTWNALPLYASIGFQVFNVCYDINATYYVAEDRNDWSNASPTFVVGSPSLLKSLVRGKMEATPLRIVWNISGTLHSDLKQETETFFACTVWTYYGINEIGGVSIMTNIQKEGSVGIPFKETIIKDDEIIVDDFKTGDLGYIDEDGFLFITGRKKDTINLGGPKVMPYEVEKALINCGADDCVVFGYSSVNALVVGVVDLDKLESLLIHYKIPTTMHYVDSIPYRNGKISRKKLISKYSDEQVIQP